MSDPFFNKKRPWSRYKDEILRYYLKPYLPKVAFLKQPIILIDCFAGCGRFGDGEPGSPLIICEAISSYQGKPAEIRAVFIEYNQVTCEQLSRNTAIYRDFIECRNSSFEKELKTFEQLTRNNTVFLYIDPYSVRGLDFEKMFSVYSNIHNAGMSVEVLLNFNVATFMRWALAALQRQGHLISEKSIAESESEEADYLADNPLESVEISTLNSIAGGDEWIDIAKDNERTFSSKLEDFMQIYLEKMRSAFNFVGMYPIKEKSHHTIPKYMLVFGSRHPDGYVLMNDATSKARHEFLDSESFGQLFNHAVDEQEENMRKLKPFLVQLVKSSGPITRKELLLKVIVDNFSTYQSLVFNKACAQLVDNRVLVASGGTRIGDSTVLTIAET